MAKLKQWAGTIATQSLEDERQRQNRMRAAEEAGVAQTLGWPLPAETQQEQERMGNTILGDVTYPQPIVIGQQPAKSPLGTVASLLLGAAIPAAGLGGYLLQQPPPAVPVAAPVAAPAEIPPQQEVQVGLKHFHEL